MTTSNATVPLESAYAWAESARDGLRDAANALADERRLQMANEVEALADEAEALASWIAQRVDALRGPG